MPTKLFLEAEVKAEQEGQFEVIASTGEMDRMGDRINPEGWELRDFKKNPVMLWAHDNFMPPVARAKKVWVEDKRLKVKGEFAPTPFAQELKILVEQGFLNAVSVGFVPLMEDEKGQIDIEGKMYRHAEEEELKSFEEKRLKGEGMRFEKQELLEVSWVAVPALASALVTARKGGFELPLLTKSLETKKNTKSPTCRMDDETEAECRSRKIPELKDEGMDQEQAVAAAISICKKPCGERSQESIIEKFEEKADLLLTQMGEAISTLTALSQKDAAPVESKGRAQEKIANGMSPEVHLLQKANQAVDRALARLKQDKLLNKREILLTRIADKVIEAALMKAKAKLHEAD